MGAPESVRDLKEEQRTATKSWVGVMLGLWLSGVFASSLLGKLDAETNRSIGMPMLAAAIMWPLAYFLFSRSRFIPRTPSPGRLLALCIFGLFCTLSSYVSKAGFDSAGYTVLTLMACWIILQFNTFLDSNQLERGLKLYAVLMTGLIVGFSLYDYTPGMRLGGGTAILNSNALALVTISPFLAAMAIHLKLLRFALMGALGVVVVLTGSRASAVGALVGLIIIFLLRLRTIGTKGLIAILLCLLIGGAAAAYFGESILPAVDQFFALHDRHRGVESGASGRFETWAVVWNMFLDNPILGVGFRAHEMVIKINTSAHNGYLALLAEIGIVGFAAAMYLTLSGLRSQWDLTKDRSRNYTSSILFGLSCGYCALAIFERYFINVGNPTSLLFLLSVLAPAHCRQPVVVAAPDKMLSPDVVVPRRRTGSRAYS